MSVAPQVNPRLAALLEAGTSPWLDQIRRSLIEGGELERLIAEDSLRGVTANPSIFEKAILGSDDYDDELRSLPADGLGTEAIYDAIAVRDVQLACDALRPVWEEASGRDGNVSLEVAPRLAHDTEGTLEAARTYWAKLDRPNAMIKIPGTPAGVPAIEQAIYEGMNVNVTLLFALSAYEEAAEAYVQGMERRHAEGLSLDVHSVASFFVSRVDTEVDRRLESLGRSDLAGTAALANARAAYARFKAIFYGARFAALREAGAPVQRPLWASTGVKNPRYSDTMYVDRLVAPDTVNTMPMPTLLAVAERGEVTGATADEDPAATRAALDALAEAGIDMDDVTDRLLREGVELFAGAMDKLIDGIESRREAVVTGRPLAIESVLPDELEPMIAERVARLSEDRVARRLWRQDISLWGGGEEIANRLGWLTVADQMLEALPDLEDFAARCRADGLTDAVLLGMGGSSLAPEVLTRTFFGRTDGMALHMLDSTDPAAILAVERAVELSRTLFLVSAKSGVTLETISLFRYFHARVGEALGSGESAGRHFAAVTDAGSSLEGLAREHGFRRTFLNDPDIGGRYSALSHFGMVPAALIGAPAREILEGAQVAEQACASHEEAEDSPGLWLGAALGALAEQGRDKLTLVVDEPMGSFGLWAEQLVAESLGKQGKGIVPVAGEELGPPSAYGHDRVFVHLSGEEGDDPFAPRLAELGRAGHAVVTLNVHGPADIGRIFFLAEYATAVAGWALEVNPFDQPNVQEAKNATSGVLEGYRASGSLPEVAEADDEALRSLLARLEPPSYLAVMGYLAPSEAVDAAISTLRVTVREATRATTTFGYGPRFLHSTGQLHKGGPPTGVFLQLVHDGDEDVEVPEAGHSFATLKNAQAVGDLKTLRSHGLPAERVRLEGEPAEAIEALTERLRSLLPGPATV